MSEKDSLIKNEDKGHTDIDQVAELIEEYARACLSAYRHVVTCRCILFDTVSFLTRGQLSPRIIRDTEVCCRRQV